MANEQSGSTLRRWRPFYGAFGAIDDAIEAAAGGHPRAAFRDARARIIRLLRGAADDDGAAEQLCAALDDAMVEALQTLWVAAPVPRSALLETAVGALGNHGSARIRSLAGDVVRGWKTTANVAATATSVKEEELSFDRIPRQGVPTAMNKVVSKMEAKKPPIAAQIEQQMEAKKKLMFTESEKMETTKRKLREGYEEAMKVKRQHRIKKIEDKEAPKLWERSQRKMHRGPAARCRIISSAVLCFPLFS